MSWFARPAPCRRRFITGSGLARLFAVAPTTDNVVLATLDLAIDHRLKIWDSVILSDAAEANCRLPLSEDLQDGFPRHGVTVANPFAPLRHAWVDTILSRAKPSPARR